VAGLKYLVITELFLPTKGGTAVWFDEVYRRLGGKENHIVTAEVPGAADHDACHANSIHRVSLNRYWWMRPESLAMYLRLLVVSVTVFLRHPIDIVHAGRVLPEGIVAWMVAMMFGKPLVIYAHGEEITTWRQPAKFRVMRFAYRRADKVIANSEFTYAELIKLGVKKEKIAIISPGVDVNRFCPGLHCSDLRTSIGVEDDGKLILSVGRLSRRKGFDKVIQAIPALVKKGVDAHYAIVGIGEDEQYLQDLIKDGGLGERVHLLGHVESSDLPRWYNACDVFAMPNREIDGDTEGFGMVFLEAAGCGKPAIAGNAGGTGAAVVENVTGLRVDGNDLKEVVNGLMRILSHDEFARSLGSQGHLRAVREFAWEVVAEKTAQLQLSI